MREPSYQDFETVHEAVNYGDEDEVYAVIDELGLPQERAAHFYSYCVEAMLDSPTVEDIRTLYAKAWQ